MKTPIIGILAGMGPRSTAPFLNMVLDECKKQYGATNDADFPPIIIYSLPTPFFADRPLNHEKMKQAVIAGLQKLAAAGVSFIAIPCNVVHQYFDNMQKSVKIPLISMIDETVHSINPKLGTIAILATQSTIESNIYQKAFESTDVKYTIEPPTVQHMTELIKNVKAGLASGLLQKQWAALMSEIKNSGAKQILIACTDLSSLAQNNDTNIIDAAKILARATVHTYLKLKE